MGAARDAELFELLLYVAALAASVFGLMDLAFPLLIFGLVVGTAARMAMRREVPPPREVSNLRIEGGERIEFLGDGRAVVTSPEILSLHEAIDLASRVRAPTAVPLTSIHVVDGVWVSAVTKKNGTADTAVAREEES